MSDVMLFSVFCLKMRFSATEIRVFWLETSFSATEIGVFCLEMNFSATEIGVFCLKTRFSAPESLIIALDVGNLLVKLFHLLLLEHAFVLDGHNLDKVLDVAVPVVEHATCEG